MMLSFSKVGKLILAHIFHTKNKFRTLTIIRVNHFNSMADIFVMSFTINLRTASFFLAALLEAIPSKQSFTSCIYN